jgi:hypothetical protein
MSSDDDEYLTRRSDDFESRLATIERLLEDKILTGIKVTAVPPDFFCQFWPQIEPLFEDAMSILVGRYLPVDVLRKTELYGITADYQGTE